MPRVRLPDGLDIEVRPLRPTDGDALRDAFARLSPQSRYTRFLSPMSELRPAMLRELTELDQYDRAAVVALDATSGAGLGVARYVRLSDRPEAAEAAVTVVDEAQGLGIGSLLLSVLAARASQAEIRVFVAVMLARNEVMRDLLEGLGPTDVVDRHEGTVRLEVALPRSGLSERLRAMLRAARHARNDTTSTTIAWQPRKPA